MSAAASRSALDGDAAVVARRFCGLTLVACDMLATGQRNLLGHLRNDGSQVRYQRTHHRAADTMPADFLLALSRLLPPYRLMTDEGRRPFGVRALPEVLPLAVLSRDSSLIEMLGPGAVGFFYDFCVMAMTSSDRVRGRFHKHPVMAGRFVLGLAQDETRAVVEVHGENVTRRESDGDHGDRSAFVTGLGVYHAEVRLAPGTVATVFVSEENDTISNFSGGFTHSFVRRWLLPRLYEVGASLKLREAPVPPFGIEVTCVSDQLSCVTLGAWPPIW